MAASVHVQPDGPHQWAVRVDEGGRSTSYRVRVPTELPFAVPVGADGAPDEARVVEASFFFLLEREPASSILRSFSLEVIGRYFLEWGAEMGRRLG